MVTSSADAAAVRTDAGETGWIQPHTLDELWIHTGTACNLDCPFCLEGSKPGDNRLQRVTLADVRPLFDEAVRLNVRQFSFTGGEPFVVKDMVAILEYAAELRPCLVLTNGTAPVVRRMAQIRKLAGTPHPITFRVSLDHADE
ncbi:MAG: radical SAM protein, partial [Gammaproteobacteria bacterium]|nr:radical SAM protein [Gammaproteobacteria bacterium]